LRNLFQIYPCNICAESAMEDVCSIIQAVKPTESSMRRKDEVAIE